MAKRIWRFNGSGSYSESYEWDNGISTRLGDETTFEAARKDVAQRVEDSPCFNSNDLPATDEKEQIDRLYECFFNEHGGNRVVSGFVVALDRKSAGYILQDYENAYQVVECVTEEDEDIFYPNNYLWTKNNDVNSYVYDKW